MMKLYNQEIADIISAASESGQDLFLIASSRFSVTDVKLLSEKLNKKLLVLLPGPFYPTFPVSGVQYVNKPGDLYNFCGAKVVFADVRLLGDGEFTAFLEQNGFSELLLPFAECASPYEYGYRLSYRQIGELRASGAAFHITALISMDAGEKILAETFGSQAYIVAGKEAGFSCNLLKSNKDAERDHYTENECEKSPFTRTVVFFLTRRQAEKYASFLFKRNASFALIHGGREYDKNLSALGAFQNGEANVLLATKHVLASAPFLDADQLIFCGLPVSEAHARRLTALGKTDKLSCFYSETDISLVHTLLPGYKESMMIEEADFVSRKTEDFNAFLRKFKSE